VRVPADADARDEDASVRDAEVHRALDAVDSRRARCRARGTAAPGRGRRGCSCRAGGSRARGAPARDSRESRAPTSFTVPSPPAATTTPVPRRSPPRRSRHRRPDRASGAVLVLDSRGTRAWRGTRRARRSREPEPEIGLTTMAAVRTRGGLAQRHVPPAGYPRPRGTSPRAGAARQNVKRVLVVLAGAFDPPGDATAALRRGRKPALDRMARDGRAGSRCSFRRSRGRVHGPLLGLARPRPRRSARPEALGSGVEVAAGEVAVPARTSSPVATAWCRDPSTAIPARPSPAPFGRARASPASPERRRVAGRIERAGEDDEHSLQRSGGAAPAGGCSTGRG